MTVYRKIKNLIKSLTVFLSLLVIDYERWIAIKIIKKYSKKI